MKIITAKNCGFCFGVENALKLAYRTAAENPDKKVYTLGKLIHNELVTDKLLSHNIAVAEGIDNIEDGSVVIIRSHGAPKEVFEKLAAKNLTVMDATCQFVKKIQNIVSEFHTKGYQIVILGEPDHPEVVGINGWCEKEAVIVRSEAEAEGLKRDQKLCLVAQTTFSAEKYARIVKIFQKPVSKSVEIFDTICYTTYKRQAEADLISRKCDVMLVLGSEKSSNTVKLYEICKKGCDRCYLVPNAADFKKIIIKAPDLVGIVAGASTPPELIMEVKDLMAQQFNNEIQSTEFMEALEGSPISLREGKRVKGTVISADEKGISVNIGSKKDGFVPIEEAGLGEYNPSEYVTGMPIEAVVVSTKSDVVGCIILSKKRIDIILEGDKQVETIRNGEIFELKIEKDTNGGLLGKMGTYTVFIPASQVREVFVRDLKPFSGKTLRLTALEIDDKKRRIVASARKVIEEERKAREEIFWNAVQPDVIVNGKVKRVTNFGAFVSVDGFDCLAHIVDLSWNHIKNAEDVVKVGKNYDFLVLSVDRERGRVSLSYKALQPHPFEACLAKHPVGSITKGKVTSIVPFGVFVEIEPGIEGLVHVSEAAHNYVKSVSEVVKVGEEIDVMILNADPNSKKINLSIKACQEAPEVTGEEGVVPAKPKSSKFDRFEADASGSYKKPEKSKADSKSANPKTSRRTKSDSDAEMEWSEEASNNPFAELLQGIKVDKE